MATLGQIRSSLDIGGISTNCIRSFRVYISRLGHRIDLYRQTASPGKRYITDGLLQLPLLIIIHNWLLLAPTSPYWFLEIFLWIVRYSVCCGCFILSRLSGHTAGCLLPMYLGMTVCLLFGWVTEISFQMFQSEADEVCDALWGEGGVPWLFVCFANIAVHVLYAVFVVGINGGMNSVSMIQKFFITMSFVSLFPCAFSAFLKYSSPLHYCLSKFSFTTILFDLSLDNVQIPEFDNGIMAGTSVLHSAILRNYPWFHRGTLAIFTLTQYVFGLLVDGCDMGLAELLFFDYLTGFLGNWATTSMVILGLAVGYGFITKWFIVVGKYIVTGERDAALALLRSNPFLMEQYVIAFSFFADVLTVDNITRINNYRVVLLLLFYRIVHFTWECVEPDFYVAVKSGITNIFDYVRLLIYAGIMTSVPTMLMFRAANYFNYDVWLLLNATGNIVILCRVSFTLIELVLLRLSWYPEIQLEVLEDLIYFVQLSKNLSIGITIFLWKYYSALIPVFSSWFYIIIPVAALDGAWSFNRTVYKEWVAFQTRRRFLDGLSNLPDASEEQLNNLQDVCSICHSELQEGKLLQCAHIFHYSCLRRCFQVRSNCPMCNRAVILV